MAFCCHLLINQRKRQQKLIACPGSIPRAGAAFSAGSWGWKRWLMRMDLPSGLDEDGFTFGVGWGWIYLLGGQSAKYLSAVLTDEHQGCAGREVYYKHSSSSLPWLRAAGGWEGKVVSAFEGMSNHPVAQSLCTVQGFYTVERELSTVKTCLKRRLSM